jgi:hypothetical protein
MNERVSKVMKLIKVHHSTEAYGMLKRGAKEQEQDYLAKEQELP